jgi:hypothetical protein
MVPKSIPIKVYEIIRPHENAIERKNPRCFNGDLEETSPNNTGRRAMVQELNEATAPAKATAIKTSNNDPLKRIFRI